MSKTLVDEAARLLELEPARTLDADALYARARRAAREGPPLDEFIASLRAQPHRFTVVAGSCPAIDDSAWPEQERVRYRRAFDAAGATTPVVTLAEHNHEPFAAPERTVASNGDQILHEVHECVVQLARAADGAAIGAQAIHELQAIRRALPQ